MILYVKTFHMGFLFVMIFLWVTAATGISFLQFTNLNSLRSLFIVGTSLFLGLSIPQYFNEYTATAGYGPVRSGARWVIVSQNFPSNNVLLLQVGFEFQSFALFYNNIIGVLRFILCIVNLHGFRFTELLCFTIYNKTIHLKVERF